MIARKDFIYGLYLIFYKTPDGDGKPDYNIDTDNDDRPDINLVILKEWKPNKCVEIDGIKYSGGINAKPKINIDLDGDNVPDINIDTNGDFKADFNVDTDGDNKANINIGTVHNPWTPDKNYSYQGFLYDTDIECKPYLNLDSDGDGTPDENIIKITEWKPGHDVNEPFPYDTMTFDDPEPEEPNTPTNPGDQDPDTNVNGTYYPGTNMGGATTGDTTNIMVYMGLGCCALGLLFLLLYKRNQADEDKW